MTKTASVETTNSYWWYLFAGFVGVTIIMSVLLAGYSFSTPPIMKLVENTADETGSDNGFVGVYVYANLTEQEQELVRQVIDDGKTRLTGDTVFSTYSGGEEFVVVKDTSKYYFTINDNNTTAAGLIGVLLVLLGGLGITAMKTEEELVHSKVILALTVLALSSIGIIFI